MARNFRRIMDKTIVDNQRMESKMKWLKRYFELEKQRREDFQKCRNKLIKRIEKTGYLETLISKGTVHVDVDELTRLAFKEIQQRLEVLEQTG